jgi:pimeloyl-ACP methyl ester carboxylesterase
VATSQAEAAGAESAFRDGRGSPLVLLHGAMMSWRAWKPVLPMLTAHHDVFAPTMAGHRGGPEFPDGVTPGISAVADLLCSQLDREGIGSAHLVGNSLGGWLAFELARRGRARSVVAFSPAGTWQARRDLMRVLLMFRLGAMMATAPYLDRLTRPRAMRRLALSRCYARPWRLSDEEIDDGMRDMRECELLTALLSGEARLHPMTEFDVALCPVTIAWGGRDKVIPYRRYGRPMRERVRGAHFVMLRGVGHVPMADDPRLVARTILETTAPVDAAAEIVPVRKRWRRARKRTA